MFNQSRRTLLKGLTYISALSLTGASGLAVAKSGLQATGIDAALSRCDVHLLPTQYTDINTLSLFNNSDSELTIEGITQLSPDNEGKLLAIKLKKPGQIAGSDSVTLAPFEGGEFAVTAASNDYREIRPNQSPLPVTIFDRSGGLSVA